MNYELKLKNIIIKNNNPGKFGVICFNEFIIPINKEENIEYNYFPDIKFSIKNKLIEYDINDNFNLLFVKTTIDKNPMKNSLLSYLSRRPSFHIREIPQNEIIVKFSDIE